MTTNQTIHDITVIGGGPVGLFTAFYGGMRQASVNIIESLPQLGGQLSTLYPEKYIYDIAGFPKVKAQDLVDNLLLQMEKFNPTITLNEEVLSYKRLEDGLIELTTSKNTHITRSVIITAGNGAFQPRRLELEGAEQFEGKNLHYFIKNMNQFANRHVVICGGGDSAVDWALMLEPIAASVTLVHRRDKFRAHEHSVELLNNSRVKLQVPYVPVELQNDGEKVTGLVVKHTKEDETVTLPVDDLIVNFGFVSTLGPLKDWGLELQRNNIVVNSKMETNIEGIYAAGDICTYDGKVKLIASGFGEAPTAVNNAKTYFDPGAKVQPMHSTSMFE